MEFVIGGLAGMGAGLFTNPFDVVKTRMQLQGELQHKGKYEVHYRSVPHAMYVIMRKDGVFAVQKGLVPALIYQFFLNSTRLGLYHTADIQRWNRNKDGTLSIPRNIVCASMAGAAGGLVGSPLYLIKTQIQSSSHESIAVGKQHGHEGTWNACKNIYGAYGWRGFYKGITSSIVRLTVASSTQLPTFTSAKETLKSHQVCPESPVMLAILASMVSGVVVVLATCPFDVVCTRLNNQGSDAQGKGQLYSGVWDCLIKIFQREGLNGFYKGLMPLYMRLAPHTVLSLVFWDKLKTYI